MTKKNKHRPSEEEIDQMIAFGDGALGAAGHEVTDPQVREWLRQNLRGDISDEEYEHRVLQHNLGHIPASFTDPEVNP